MLEEDCCPGATLRRPVLQGSPAQPAEEDTISPAPSLVIKFTSIGASDILLADAVMTVLSASSNCPCVDLSVTNTVSDSESGLLHRGCSHEPLPWGTAVLGLDPKTGARVVVEEAGMVAVGAEVSGTTDTDPQAITASMIARQDVIRTL